MILKILFAWKNVLNPDLFARKSVILSLKNKVVPCLKGK